MSDIKKRRGMRLTVITTKFGDFGETYISGGFVLKKNHPRVKAYGTVDELCSFIGYTISVLKEDETNMREFIQILEKIQNHLFILGGDLARLLKPSDEITESQRRLTEKPIDWLEDLEKKYLKELEPLEDFILPGGSKEGSLFHILRTITRRCEREIVELAETEKINPKCIKYINRLSDLFFILARIINKKKGIEEKIINWEQK